MYLILLVTGYILGSIPTSLLIGKLFYHTDIRESGSHNLGGTNALRVLGKVGYLVIVLDALKCVFAVYLGSLYSSTCASYAGLLACIGHCYPVFANFKGGKAVACSYGFFLATALFVNNYYLTLILSAVSFIVIWKSTDYVSLASIISSVIAWITSLFQPYFSINVSTFVIMLIVIYRHRENIKRLLKHEENKFSVKKQKGR